MKLEGNTIQTLEYNYGVALGEIQNNHNAIVHKLTEERKKSGYALSSEIKDLQLFLAEEEARLKTLVDNYESSLCVVVQKYTKDLRTKNLLLEHEKKILKDEFDRQSKLFNLPTNKKLV